MEDLKSLDDLSHFINIEKDIVMPWSAKFEISTKASVAKAAPAMAPALTKISEEYLRYR